MVDALRRAPEDPELLGDARRDPPRPPRLRRAPARWRRSSPPRTTRRRRPRAPGSRRRGCRARAAPRRRWCCSRGSPAAAPTPGDGGAGARPGRGRRRGGARGYLDGVLARDPGNPAARLLAAGLAAAGATTPPPRPATARWSPTPRDFRRGLAGLGGLLAGTGRGAEAAAALDAGLAAVPGDADLMFASAGLAEAAGDREGAIALYEALYARDTGAPVIANNLASLSPPRAATPRPSSAPSASPGGSAARTCRRSRTPTAGCSSCAATRPRPRLPVAGRRGDARQRRGAVPPRRGRVRARALDAAKASYDRALAAAATGSPLPEAATASAAGSPRSRRCRRAHVPRRPRPETTA